MAAVAAYPWATTRSPSSPSPDVPSSAYPERVIRPLPKRPLKSRLSDQQAHSIVYPPVLPSSSPLFSSPFNPGGEGTVGQGYTSSDVDPRSPLDHEHSCDCGGEHSDLDSDGEGDEYGTVAHRYFEPSTMQPFPRVDRTTKVHAPNSSASSGDGYESFENTNNKKKRKIPVSGSGGYLSGVATDHSASLSTQTKAVFGEEFNAGVFDHERGSKSYSDRSDFNASGIARRRYLKTDHRNGGHRQITGTAPSTFGSYYGHDGANDYPATEPSTKELASMTGPRPTAAIKGKENFTFNAPSESSKKMGLVPQYGFAPQPIHQANATNAMTGVNSQSRGSSTGMQSNMNAGSGSQPPHQESSMHAPQLPQPPPIEDKEALRRSHNRELRLQARQRRLRAEYNAFHAPPSRDDVWICEFCEYESVFGHPPRAFIRRFEETQLKKQKQAENNKRLIEKARKTVKSKKHSKGQPKGSMAAHHHQPVDGQLYDPTYDDLADADLDDQGEELFESNYGEVPPLPSTHAPKANLNNNGPALGSALPPHNSLRTDPNLETFHKAG